MKVLPCGRQPSEMMTFQKSPSESLNFLVSLLNQHLTKSGLKQSESRIQILEVLLTEKNHHFTPAQLIKSVLKKYSQMGSATVYRNIQLFLEAGILREILTLENGERVYEVEHGMHHDHIICLDCHSLFEFHETAIEKVQDTLCKKNGFTPERHKHVIYAHCDRLKKQ
jgi:Fur family ferric uptake transcriptional regulator